MDGITLPQTTNFRLFQTFADDNFKFEEMKGSYSKRQKTQWKKEKLLVTSNFSFSHSVFNRLLLQTRKNQGFFGEGLS